MRARALKKAGLLVGTFLVPMNAFAQDDSFVLGDAPVVQAPPPVFRNFVEGGLGYQTDAPYYMARYGGVLHEAPYLIFKAGLAGSDAWDGKSAKYWDADADVTGFDTRSFHGRVGEQGKWRFGGSYDAFARAYTERAYTPFDGVGGTTLTLPLNWVASSSSAGFATLNRNLKAAKLRVGWETVAGDFVLTPYPRYEVRIHTRYRARDGLRAQSLPFGQDGDSAVGVFFPQRVDYRSSEIAGSIGYADRRLQWSIGYTFSAFSDQIDATKVSDPFRSLGPPGPAGAAGGYPNAVGQYGSPPDSSAHQVLGTLGYSITPTTRFTARASYIVQNQNDPFLPYTANPLLAAATPLPRTSLQGSIRKTNIALGLTAQPLSHLDLSARYTFDDRDNRSPMDVYNYVANDVQNQFPLVPGASRYIRLNLPHSFTFHNAKLEAKYRLMPQVSLVLGYDGDFQYRTNQQVDYTAEHALRAKLLGTFENGSGWISYRYASRTGSAYNDALPWNLSHTQAYLNASRNNQSIEFPQMRKYHLADRDRQEVKAGTTFDVTQAIALNFSGGYNVTTYPDSAVGLTKSKSLVLDADASYALENNVTASAFYTFERALSRQTDYLLGNGNLTNPLQYWQAGNRDTTHTLGVRADWRVVPGKYKLGVNYDLSLGGMRADFDANTFVVYTVTAPLPDTREITHNFGVKAEYAVRVDTTVKIGYNFQRHVSRDWQYDLSITPVAQVLGSGILPPRYTAHVVSLTTRFDF